MPLTGRSRESFVVLAIRRHFPGFQTRPFVRWLEASFLPVLLSAWVRGYAEDLRAVADAGVVWERQQAIGEQVVSGLRVRSRLLTVSDVEVVEFDFAAQVPLVSLRCFADYIEDVRTEDGAIVTGGPEAIRRTEFFVAVTVDTTGPEPVWKTSQLRVGARMRRI